MRLKIMRENPATVQDAINTARGEQNIFKRFNIRTGRDNFSVSEEGTNRWKLIVITQEDPFNPIRKDLLDQNRQRPSNSRQRTCHSGSTLERSKLWLPKKPKTFNVGNVVDSWCARVP